jgi:hypothetical protein
MYGNSRRHVVADTPISHDNKTGQTQIVWYYYLASKVADHKHDSHNTKYL